MTHKSQLGGLVIDCNAEDIGPATAFWSAALGIEGTVDPDGKYAQFAGSAGGLELLVQSVDHAPRVHLDLVSDDIEAEAARLERHGAKRIEAVKRWIVMEAPTGHRFCIVEKASADMGADAATWDGD
ncbi:VOC family protein [Amorphus coralli]|uniref:VOC family protein n=1 Tax=Amorphus coralli TaxID=340680 RepID=UPI0003635A82|nr:VOC family protein [Amorphus coralli]